MSCSSGRPRQRDLARIRSLGAKAAGLDALFHHRVRECAPAGTAAVGEACTNYAYPVVSQRLT